MIITKFSAKILITIILIIFILLFFKTIKFIKTERKLYQAQSTLTKSQESTNISYVQSLDQKQVPIPNGYTASQLEGETAVKSGFVIYEGQIDWNQLEKETNNKKIEILKIQSKTNQYVWIPVEEEELNTIYGVDQEGKIWGKSYEYTQNGQTPKDWSQSDGKIAIKLLNKYLEPGLGYGANGININELTTKNNINKSRIELIRELEQNYYQTIKSIKKYGGFYIGRYETGIEKNEAVIQKMNENIANQTWAEMYKKIPKIKGENENITTSMIWGSLWDFTIQWLVKTGNKTYNDIISSTTWGNYRDSEFEYYTNREGSQSTKNAGSNNAKIIPAGSSEYTKTNNIYDIAGNVAELTLQNYAQYITIRGGDYNSYKTTATNSSYRAVQAIDQRNLTTGSRAIMLLK